MVAKIASQSAKPNGLKYVPQAEVRGFLDPLPVRRIWGVGPVTGDRIVSAGFETLGDLARETDAELTSQLGDWGVEIAKLARGEDVRDVEPYRDAVSYSEEHTFMNDISDHDMLESMIPHPRRVGGKTVAAGRRAGPHRGAEMEGSKANSARTAGLSVA
ncbi:MAG: hypothetical protein CM1200mP20_07160 [Pseudomonadota bacterium]|nr:MAG: hypothetical protein CM1200mP20_07160 [Pseudomonadota bacterium]